MTPEREEKFRRVITLKQTNLTVVLENVHDPHNISAVLRSCDAVGIAEVFVINAELANSDKKQKAGKKSSASAKKWMQIHYFEDTASCFRAVRSRFKTILTTGLGERSSSLYELDLTESMALVFGNEMSGISQEAFQLADGNFLIPQMGMIPSLNISVACAVTLYEACRQRMEKQLYPNPASNQAMLKDLHHFWLDREENKRQKKIKKKKLKS